MNAPDELWSKLQAILFEDSVYNKFTHRQTLEGILSHIRVACSWRDLPECFDLWNMIYRRFLLRSKKEGLIKLFKSPPQNSDTEWEFIDGNYVKAHQHSTDADSEHEEAIALS
jgi:transposase